VRHFIIDECDKVLDAMGARPAAGPAGWLPVPRDAVRSAWKTSADADRGARADMRADVQEIFKMTPHDKQVMMFSATLSAEVRPVCKKFMSDVCPSPAPATLTRAPRPPLLSPSGAAEPSVRAWPCDRSAQRRARLQPSSGAASPALQTAAARSPESTQPQHEAASRRPGALPHALAAPRTSRATAPLAAQGGGCGEAAARSWLRACMHGRRRQACVGVCMAVGRAYGA